MPCRSDIADYSNPHTDNELKYKKEIDKLTQDLCYLCGQLEELERTDILNPRIQEWWIEHQTDDYKRVTKAMAEYVRKFKIKNANTLAECFIKKALEVHPVSDFHKNWFYQLAAEIMTIELYSEQQQKIKLKNIEKARKILIDSLTTEEIKILKNKL